MKNIAEGIEWKNYGKAFKVQLEAQHAASGLPVVPGARWGFFYADGTPASWAQKILDGDLNAVHLGEQMRPKAMIYDQSLVADPVLRPTIVPTVRATAYIASNTDYDRVARFVMDCKEKHLSVPEIFTIHDSLAENALYAQALQKLGSTGRKDINTVVANRAHVIADELAATVGIDRILKSLQLSSMVNDFGNSPSLLPALACLSDAEQAMVQVLFEPYRRFVASYDEPSWQAVIEPLLATIPPRPPKPEEEQAINDQFEQQVTEQDNHDAIAPEDRDEYDTPPLPPDSPPPGQGPAESNDKLPDTIFFRVAPKLPGQAPLGGYYITGRNSYYDRDTKTWSKRKQLTAHVDKPLAADRYILTANLKPGITAIPLPQGYGIVATSAANISFSEDQYGCVYANVSQFVTAKIEFGKLQGAVGMAPPIPDDMVPLHPGVYEQKIEQLLQCLQGDHVTRAHRAGKWIKTNKSYPKDLKAAHAVQLRLRTQSTKDNYLPTLAASPELECYSSATLFLDWARRLGIPARLVLGHMIQKAQQGQCFMTSETGHAWGEVWDGKKWRRIDVTPPKKKDDEEQDGDKGDSPPEEDMDNAQDDAIDVSPEQDLSEKIQDRQDQAAKQMEDAISDAEMQSAKQNMDKVQKAMEQAEKRKKQLEQQINQAQSFQDLNNKQQEQAADPQLFDEMHDELQKKLDQKKEAMKDALQKQLDSLAEQGFIEDKDREQLQKEIDQEGNARKLDKLAERVKLESSLEMAYEKIVEDLTPLVDEWYQKFLEILPKQKEPDFDFDTVARSSHLDRHAITRPRAITTGLYRNPREYEENLIPKFIASILVDVSGSMNQPRGRLGQPKILIALMTLVFYAELFSKIAKEHDYLRFAISVFDDTLRVIKGYEQKYDENIFYDYDQGANAVRTTVKARIMKAVQAGTGTNMLDALVETAQRLTDVVQGDREYASALYLIGDGGDSYGNERLIKKLVSPDYRDESGEHMYAALVLGNEDERRILAAMFGDQRTAVADDFESMITIAMQQFQEDIVGYLEAKMR
ncbi:hypothetical protein KA517_03115 [Candidatus Gracilibacteria bacterium]|nr:hypothetical protein [Candidatus Gracilibacteria bacterium]